MKQPPSEDCLLANLLAVPDARDRDLFDKANEYYRAHSTKDDTRNLVRSANSKFGTDFATAVLYHHFQSQLMDWSVDSQPIQDPSSDEPQKLKLVIAPGAFYREHPDAGGDGKSIFAVAQKLGWDCEVIPTESIGTLDANAQIITQWIENQTDDFVLVSLSKGTSDAMTALSQSPHLAEKVQAWISISGVFKGTPMSNWLLQRKVFRPILWYMCWKHQSGIEAIRDLCSGSDGRLHTIANRLQQPSSAKIPLYHIAGFPLKRHLSCYRSKLWHRRFRQYGPNDSVVILEELLDVPGVVVPVWGADHYLRSSWNSAAALATICRIVTERRLVYSSEESCSK